MGACAGPVKRIGACPVATASGRLFPPAFFFLSLCSDLLRSDSLLLICSIGFDEEKHIFNDGSLQ